MNGCAIMNQKGYRFFIQLLLIILMLTLSGCQGLFQSGNSTQQLQSSETVFEISLPSPVSESDEIFLEIVDDVTGIGLNPKRYRMQAKDAQSLFVRIPIVNGSLVKYRYVLKSESDFIERDASGEQIAYRMYFAEKPTVVADRISSWAGNTEEQPRGELSGFIFDDKTDLPISDVIVSINGNRTLTGANGYYEFNNITTGEFLVTAIHPDGLYEPFHQSALIAENALTPASFGMTSAELVEIEFMLHVPDNTTDSAPIRLIGNTFQTGNLFTELAGSASVIPSRAPLMAYEENNTYLLSLLLPSGMDFRYKYTLGNGFINAERSESGDFLTRQLIVPKKSTKIKNEVQSWSMNPDEKPILFSITTPADTPAEENLSIQFNPYTWLPPIPMQSLGQNQWTYSLYGPFEYLDQSQFRICRNDQCGFADDALTAGSNAAGFVLNLNELLDNRAVTYHVDNWVGENSVNFSGITEQYRYQKPGFMKGMVITDSYHPYTLPYLEWGLIDAAVSGSETMILSPAWQYLQDKNGKFVNLPGKTYSAAEIGEYLTYTQGAGMNLCLYPVIDLNGKTRTEFWDSVDTSYNGWLNWMDGYSRMVLNYAHFSQQNALKFMIVGGPSAAPAFPSGRLPDGNPSNTPYDISDHWESLIATVNEIYDGQIIFALTDTITAIDDYTFLDNVDAVMIQLGSSLTADNDATFQDITSGASEVLDGVPASIYSKYQKPIILGLQYASIDGSAANCVGYSENCSQLLAGQRSEAEKYPIDLTEQAMVYQAFYKQSLSRDWIVGLFSLGYDPAAIVRDEGYSVRGKPAMDVITYYNTQIIQDN